MAKGTRTKRRDGVSANTAAGTETESPILDSDPPLLSATLGENLCCLHSLVPRAYSIHPLSLVTASNQKPEVRTEDLQNQPI